LAGTTFHALLADRFASGLPRARAANRYEYPDFGRALCHLFLKPS